MPSGKAPSTITKRVSGLARVIDGDMYRELLTLPANPLRLLPKGYGSKGFDRNKLCDGERIRRLEKREDGQTEEGAIRSVLTDKKEALLFDIALETAMRLGEIFTLKTEGVDLSRRTIVVHKTKNGTKRHTTPSSLGRYRLAPSDGGARLSSAASLRRWARRGSLRTASRLSPFEVLHEQHRSHGYRDAAQGCATMG